MDAVVDGLSGAWKGGEKALIFVRRVASVKELKRKLDERYDAWLIPWLRERLPAGARSRFDQVARQYREEKHEADSARLAKLSTSRDSAAESADEEIEDRGGTDTFFACSSGAKAPRRGERRNVQRRFIQRGTVYSTFFEDNHVADLLGVRPGEVLTALAQAITWSRQRCGRDCDGRQSGS